MHLLYSLFPRMAELLKIYCALMLCLCFFACSRPFLVSKSAEKPQPVIPASRQVPGDAYFHVLAGERCLNNHDWACAKKQFQDALELDPTSAYLNLQLAHMHVLTGEFVSAAEWAEKAATLDPGNIEAHYLLGRIYTILKRPDDALQQYLAVNALAPDDEEAYFSAAMLHQQQKNSSKAVTTIKKLLKVNPRSPAAWFYLGALYSDMDKNDKAKKCYLNALDFDPFFEPALVNLALQQEADGNIDLSMETLRKIIEINPDNYRARDKLGFFYLKKGKLEDALEQYQIIARGTPQYKEEMSLKIGLILYDLERWQEAELAFAEAVEVNPRNDRAQYFYGITLERLKRTRQARLAFASVPPGSKFYRSARLHLGYMLEDAGESERARKVLQELLEESRQDPELFYYLASLYEKDAQYSRAIAILKQGLAVKPDSEELLFYLAVIYDKARLYDESITVMQQLLQHNNKNADALNFIGYSWADRNINLEKAEQFVKKALELKPGDAYIIDSLGWVYFRQGRISEAIEELKKAEALAPDETTIAEHLGDAYLANNEPDQARRLYEKVLQLEPSKETVKKKLLDMSQ